MGEVRIKELDTRARKRFENAKLALDRGNFGYAVEICSGLLIEEPGCLEVRRLLRRAQQCVFAERRRSVYGRARSKLEASLLLFYGKPYLKKNPPLAMAYGERALLRDPFLDGALCLVAAGAEALDLHETVVFCLQSIHERGNSRDVGLMQRYCEALIRTGETKEALEIAERLIRLKPENPRIQELLKSASVAHSINRGKWAEDERDFRSKLKDGALADTLERENRLFEDEDEEAASAKTRELVDAIHKDPQNLDFYKRLIRVFLSKSDYRSALAWLDKAAALPQAEADLALQQTRSEISIGVIEHELEALRESRQPHAAKREEIGNRIEKLEKELGLLKLEERRKIVEQFPNDYAQRLKYGELLLHEDRVDEAIKQFQVSQRSTSLKQKSSVLLGKSFARKGLYDLALEQFDRAMVGLQVMDAFKKEVLYLSAQYCETLGKKEEAIRRYKLIYASDIGFRDVAAKIDGFYSGEDV